MNNEIILYRPNELAEHIEVRLEDETVWLNRQQLTILLGRDVKTIGKHINNVFEDGELQKSSRGCLKSSFGLKKESPIQKCRGFLFVP